MRRKVVKREGVRGKRVWGKGVREKWVGRKESVRRKRVMGKGARERRG